MKIDSVHFYVENATKQRDYFLQKMGFSSLGNCISDRTHTEILANSSILFVVSSPLNSSSPVARYLKCHPAGVADITFRIGNLESVIAKAKKSGVRVINEIQVNRLKNPYLKWAKIQGWGDLQHTLIAEDSEVVLNSKIAATSLVNSIDHVVLNVASGQLQSAVAWYKNIFDFQSQQNFSIQTERSGLYSEALIDPTARVQFNINEPTSANSQIQVFLDTNNGSGIQHIALRSTNLVKTVSQMRRRGLSFLPIPPAYYTNLKQRYSEGKISSLKAEEWQAIEAEQILVDFNKHRPESLLMQIFTQPIFAAPTFFLELIERRKQASGFGEGNFRALFEAIERAQINKPGILTKNNG
jgi:4-hydroxyphenylpyruvate dioxygenase